MDQEDQGLKSRSQSRSACSIVSGSLWDSRTILAEVGTGLLDSAEYERLARYFCDADGDAGLRSTMGAQIEALEDAAFVVRDALARQRAIEGWLPFSREQLSSRSPLGKNAGKSPGARAQTTDRLETVHVRHSATTRAEKDDTAIIALARRWREVAQRLERIGARNASVLGVLFRWLRTEPLEARRRWSRVFAGVAPIVVAAMGRDEAGIALRLVPTFSRATSSAKR